MTTRMQEVERARMSGDLTQAMQLIKQAQTAGTMTIGLLHQYALTLIASGNYGNALEALLLIASKKPEEAQVWINIGQCSEALGDWDSALKAYDTVLRTPQSEFTARAHFGRGSNLFRLGMHSWGVDAWRKALKIPPHANEPLFMRSQVLLAFGEYAEGWKMYESRRTSPGWLLAVKGHGVDVDNLPPEWDGKAQGRVLCYAEQGAGDVVQFSRYLPSIIGASGSPPWVKVGPDMGSVVWSGNSYSLSTCAFSAPLGSLPLLLGKHEPEPPTWPEWGNLSDGKPRIGVCWKGNPLHGYDKDRSSPIDFREALKDERWEIVSLQYGEDFKPKDYLETAEIMRTLDAVVTVDTSVAHVAGTLGVPTILIPPASPEWRWGIADDKTAWYPSVKIVRRTHVDAWSNAIQRAKRELAEIM